MTVKTAEVLEQEVAALEAKVKALGEKPDLKGIHTDSEGRITGYMAETDEVSTVVSPYGFRMQTGANYKTAKKRYGRELKSAGYVPFNRIKSFGDMIRLGFENQNEFATALQAHCKAILDATPKGTATKAVQGMSVAAGADGGFSVIPEFAPGIIDRVYDNPLFAMTDNYQVSGNNMTFLANAETSRANGSRGGGVQGYWTAEGGTITKSKPTLREFTLRLCKVAAVVYLTQELIDDGGMAMEQYVAKKVSEEFNFLIGNGVTNGTGVGQPLGYLNAPCLLSIAKESTQSTASIVTENVDKMFYRFQAANLPNAMWLHNQDIGPSLSQMGYLFGASGYPAYAPPGGMSAAPYGTLKGLPMQPTEFNPTLGTQGDLALVDMGQYVTISKGGVMQAVSMHIEFLTDQLALRFTMRVNGAPWETAPMTPFQGASNTQGNFIVLDGRPS